MSQYFTIIEKEETFILKLGDKLKEFKYNEHTIKQAKQLMLDRYDN